MLIFTDGGCSGNPGPGGWAYVIADSDALDG
jgi:ribonuclease HI